MRKIERYWSEVVEQALADPNLTQVEAEFLETVPDLFKATDDDFLIATEIVEKSLIRRGWVQTMTIRPPTYHWHIAGVLCGLMRQGDCGG
jgi:hypothetical protein